MAKWPFVSLGSLASEHRGSIAIGPFGSAMKADTYSPSGVPVIRGTNISDHRSWKGDWVYIPEEFADAMPRCIARTGALVFPHRGSIGEVAIVPADKFGRYFLSSSLMKIDVDTLKANPLFVYFYFRSREGRGEILRYSSQVGTPGIGQPLESLRKFQLPLPPLPVQDAIVGVLGVLDDKIDLNRRTNETLQATIRAIFSDWFENFGPTRAKAAGTLPYLSSEIWDQFPSRLSAEERPEGWVIEPLLNHARLISGGTPKTENSLYWGGGIDWASAKDVSQCPDAFLLTTERTITDLGLAESATRIIPRLSTVVVARGATTGRYCMFGRDMAMNQTCYALSSMHGRNYWLNCAFGALVGELVHAAHGSVFDTITTKTIERVNVTVPANNLLDSFESTVKPLLLRVLVNIEESAALAETRDLLLPRLMSGEVKIRDAEKMAGVAA